MVLTDLHPDTAIYLAFGAAGIGSTIAVGLSIYVAGIPRSFLVFFARSLAVIGLTFAVTFTIAFGFDDTVR